ncbi:MAG: hypothetical protein ABJB47_06645 [Actinomycetota bacterium]
MTDYQAYAVCPQCGSAADVHSIQELTALLQGQLGGGGPAGRPAPGAPPAGPPPAGQPQGWTAGPQSGPVPGWAEQPQAGPLPGPGGRRSPWSAVRSGAGDYLPDDDLAGAALGLAAGFIGKKIGRRVQRAFNEQVLPALAARRDALIQQQTAIARRHPGLRACLADEVVFLAGGNRVVPMGNVSDGLTMEQADALVAQLSQG